MEPWNPGTFPDHAVEVWLASLIERHTSGMSRPEFLKAVRALSARYVERRAMLATRAAVDSAGKRAAFAAFFAPIHFFTTRAVVEAVGAARPAPSHLIDLGCGTGVASAAWALACSRPPTILGVDRQGWALQEATWNWRTLGLTGRTRLTELVQFAETLVDDRRPRGRAGLVLGWSVNELDEQHRQRLLPILIALASRGTSVLVIEPLAHTAAPWWNDWAQAATAAGGHAAEWKFDTALPAPLAALDEAAGFRRDGLGARSLWLG